MPWSGSNLTLQSHLLPKVLFCPYVLLFDNMWFSKREIVYHANVPLDILSGMLWPLLFTCWYPIVPSGKWSTIFSSLKTSLSACSDHCFANTLPRYTSHGSLLLHILTAFNVIVHLKCLSLPECKLFCIFSPAQSLVHGWHSITIKWIHRNAYYLLICQAQFSGNKRINRARFWLSGYLYSISIDLHLVSWTFKLRICHVLPPNNSDF